MVCITNSQIVNTSIHQFIKSSIHQSFYSLSLQLAFTSISKDCTYRHRSHILQPENISTWRATVDKFNCLSFNNQYLKSYLPYNDSVKRHKVFNIWKIVNNYKWVLSRPTIGRNPYSLLNGPLIIGAARRIGWRWCRWCQWMSRRQMSGCARRRPLKRT